MKMYPQLVFTLTTSESGRVLTVECKYNGDPHSYDHIEPYMNYEVRIIIDHIEFTNRECHVRLNADEYVLTDMLGVKTQYINKTNPSSKCTLFPGDIYTHSPSVQGCTLFHEDMKTFGNIQTLSLKSMRHKYLNIIDETNDQLTDLMAHIMSIKTQLIAQRKHISNIDSNETNPSVIQSIQVMKHSVNNGDFTPHQVYESGILELACPYIRNVKSIIHEIHDSMPHAIHSDMTAFSQNIQLPLMKNHVFEIQKVSDNETMSFKDINLCTIRKSEIHLPSGHSKEYSIHFHALHPTESVNDVSSMYFCPGLREIDVNQMQWNMKDCESSPYEFVDSRNTVQIGTAHGKDHMKNAIVYTYNRFLVYCKSKHGNLISRLFCVKVMDVQDMTHTLEICEHALHPDQTPVLYPFDPKKEYLMIQEARHRNQILMNIQKMRGVLKKKTFYEMTEIRDHGTLLENMLQNRSVISIPINICQIIGMKFKFVQHLHSKVQKDMNVYITKRIIRKMNDIFEITPTHDRKKVKEFVLDLHTLSAFITQWSNESIISICA